MPFGKELTIIRSSSETGRKGKMILGFKTSIKGKPTNFVHKILNGEKVTTIRLDKKNRWKAKNKIHFATGVRTKNYKQFAEGECTKVEEIIIKSANSLPKSHYNGCVYTIDVPVKGIVFQMSYSIEIAGKLLTTQEIEALAKDDGFDDAKAFFEWFNTEFTGKIIHFKTI
jgi:hypothetical protein